MKVSNSLYPNEEQLKGFLDPSPDGPICMVNLLKFKRHAEYEDGRETSLTGREAYELYEADVGKLLQKIGGYIGFIGGVERLVLGEVEQLWDMIALAVWPSRQSMLEVMQSEEMREISVHRAAGLEGQLNIETANFNGQWFKQQK